MYHLNHSSLLIAWILRNWIIFDFRRKMARFGKWDSVKPKIKLHLRAPPLCNHVKDVTQGLFQHIVNSQTLVQGVAI